MYELQTVFQLDLDFSNPLPDLCFLPELLIDEGLILLGQSDLSLLRGQLLADFCLPFCIGIAFPFFIQYLGFLICENC